MRPNISDLRSLGDFATTINWDVEIVVPPTALAIPSEALNFRCESSDLPKVTGTSSEILIRGIKIKQPGVYTPSGQIQLVFFETVDNIVTDSIYKWKQACYDVETGKAKPKVEIEAQIRLRRLDRNDKPIYEYMLFGSFPEDSDPGGQLQSASADPLKPVLTLSYDFAREKKL